MAKMTRAQQTELEFLTQRLHEARQAVYAAAANRDTRLSDCLALCRPDIAATYDHALQSLIDFETAMIAACRAYRGTFGVFTPYT